VVSPVRVGFRSYGKHAMRCTLGVRVGSIGLRWIAEVGGIEKRNTGSVAYISSKCSTLPLERKYSLEVFGDFEEQNKTPPMASTLRL
jgi:hypothetical protein